MNVYTEEQLQQLSAHLKMNFRTTPPAGDNRQRTPQLKRIVDGTIALNWTHAEVISLFARWFKVHNVDVDLAPTLYRDTYKKVTGTFPPAQPLTLTSFAEIEPKPVRWLFKDLIPHQEVTLLAGLNDIGKSTLGVKWMADLTQGRSDGVYAGEPVNILWITEEESTSTATRPRLDRAGADVKRAFVLAHEKGEPSHITIPDDLDLLCSTIEANDIKAVFIDPIVPFYSEGIHEYSNTDVRRALTPLMEKCREMDFSVIGVSHMRKDGARKGHSMLGSTGQEDAVRASIWVHYDEEDDTRYFGPKKNNALRDKRSHIFTLVDGIVPSSEGDIHVALAEIVGQDARRIVDIMNASDAKLWRSTPSTMESLQGQPSEGDMTDLDIEILDLIPVGTTLSRTSLWEKVEGNPSTKTIDRSILRLVGQGKIRKERSTDNKREIIYVRVSE